MECANALFFLIGMGVSLLMAAGVWWGSFFSVRPRLAIDNRIYYAPIEMRYNYCIKVTNKSRRHCLFDLEFTSDLLFPGGSIVNAAGGELQGAGSELALPLLQVWSLSDACLKPGESRLYYLYLIPEAMRTKGACAENTSASALAKYDFRQVFRKNEDVQLQIVLRCKHGLSGNTRVFYRKFLKKDFYSQLKLEA